MKHRGKRGERESAETALATAGAGWRAQSPFVGLQRRERDRCPLAEGNQQRLDQILAWGEDWAQTRENRGQVTSQLGQNWGRGEPPPVSAAVKAMEVRDVKEAETRGVYFISLFRK